MHPTGYLIGLRRVQFIAPKQIQTCEKKLSVGLKSPLPKVLSPSRMNGNERKKKTLKKYGIILFMCKTYLLE